MTAGDKLLRKRTTGYVIYFNNGPISCCSRKHPLVALSSSEAELLVLREECTKEDIQLY